MSKEKVRIRRLETGVPGLDAVLGGGLPEFSFNLVTGLPGSGKTTLSHQIMFGIAGPERRAIYFTVLGEPPLKMLRYQQQFEFFDLDKIDSAIRFVSLSAELQEGNLHTMLDRILREIEDYSPSLVFVDSFRSALAAAQPLSGAEAELQNFVHKLGMHLTGWNATTFLVGEYAVAESHTHPIFTLADGIIHLEQQMHQGSMVRKIEVVKMRGQPPLPGKHTIRIGHDGLRAFPRKILEAGSHLGAGRANRRIERLSMGNEGLDAMLGGGLPQGYSLLVAGPSGSGKTILATEFLAEGVRRGERGLIAAFEKSPGLALSRALEPMVASGEVGLISTRALDLTIDETLHEMTEAIGRLGAKRVVIDSLSGFELGLAPTFQENFRDSLYRMISTLTALGVTVVATSELEDRYLDLRFSPHGAAFLTDAIIVQRYVEIGGALKRVIAAVKVRDSNHSKALHEYEIVEGRLRVGEPIRAYEGMLSGRPTLAVTPGQAG